VCAIEQKIYFLGKVCFKSSKGV